MYLITSAAYVTGDLETEYGKIPPAFLPLQNKPLYRHQLDLLNSNELVVLSLPADFTLSDFDKKCLATKKVKIVKVPISFSLGQSVVYVLNVISQYNLDLKILHGDTLFSSLPNKLDTYLVSEATDNYAWAFSKLLNGIDNNLAYSGYFTFSNQSLLIKSITESDNYNFIEGVLRYKKVKNVVEDLAFDWLDFGHANTFYSSRTKMTTQRYFNSLEIDGYSVIKKSEDDKKIEAEAMWFKNVPMSLKRYLPALWNYGKDINDKNFYQIEYLNISSLAELFIYGRNELFIWKNILNVCSNFISDCYKLKHPVVSKSLGASKMYGEKTVKRLEQYKKQENIDFYKQWKLNGESVPSINDIMLEVNPAIYTILKDQYCVSHGDFCFSNILYDFRTKNIKVIDPRGIDVDGVETVYGDVRYDIAKLAHSVIGMYDFIIAGHFTYKEIEGDRYNIEFDITSNSLIEKIQAYFLTIRFANMSTKQACVYPILINLFLSMLPLHKDNPARQKAMLANVFRLYLEYKKSK